VCLINAIYDIAIGILSLLPDPTVSLEVMEVAPVFGICLITLRLGPVGAFRNLEGLSIVRVMNIVANSGMTIDYLWVLVFAPLPLNLRLVALPFAIIPAVFGILLLAYMSTTKGSFSAAFRTTPSKK
jgi:hypothetical protein